MEFLFFAIQVLLTIPAFENGWRYWVSVPWTITIVAGMVAGASSIGPDAIDNATAGFLLNVGLIGALAHMSMPRTGVNPR